MGELLVSGRVVPEDKPSQKEAGSSSNFHHFSGANSLLNFGGAKKTPQNKRLDPQKMLGLVSPNILTVRVRLLVDARTYPNGPLTLIIRLGIASYISPLVRSYSIFLANIYFWWMPNCMAMCLLLAMLPHESTCTLHIRSIEKLGFVLNIPKTSKYLLKFGVLGMILILVS